MAADFIGRRLAFNTTLIVSSMTALVGAGSPNFIAFAHKIRSLFTTPRMALSTTMMLFLWISIGMAYPLYKSLIPIYLENCGVKSGTSGLNNVYHNYVIQAVCGIPTSILSGYTVNLKRVGRKGTGSMACICI